MTLERELGTRPDWLRMLKAAMLAPLSLLIAAPVLVYGLGSLWQRLAPGQQGPPLPSKPQLVGYIIAPLVVGVFALVFGYLGMAVFAAPFYRLLFSLRARRRAAFAAAALLGYIASVLTIAGLNWRDPHWLQNVAGALLNPANLLNPIQLSGAVLGLVFWLIARPPPTSMAERR